MQEAETATIEATAKSKLGTVCFDNIQCLNYCKDCISFILFLVHPCASFLPWLVTFVLPATPDIHTNPG